MSDYETLRQKALERRRRLIYDNDGCDVYQCKSPSPSELLSKRTIPLCGSHADTLFCTTRSSGFGLFTHNTKIGQIFTGREGKHEYNITEELIKQGKDYLQIMTDFCRKNNIEIFWSMRMNDVHDSGTTLGRPEAFRLNKIKTEHPEYLFGSRENPPKYGAWSGVDYTREEIRELAYAFVEEVCSNYDIDGINLDFFRHPVFFKRTAWGLPIQQYELDLMTDLMRKIRKMTIEIGKERGRPILLSSRVPDSLEYSRTIGIDLETWLKEVQRLNVKT
ncbi:MAG: hypothetical protein GX754_00710 [Clostridiaceae bacterium]|nr:hypothetical protein [Clostridiaceae bacterium]